MSIEGKTEELAKNMGDLKTEPEEKKMSSAKKVAKKKVAKKTATKKEVDPNQVTLKALCKDLKMDPRVARRKLRAADLKAEGRWSWTKDSGALKKVEKVLSEKDEA